MGINGPSLGSVNDVIWQYTVTFTNATPDVMDDIAIFWSTTSGALSFKSETNWSPGERRVFQLGTCGEMVEYNIGVWIGTQEVARFPAQGSMSRQRATLDNPSDNYLCEDSWRIEAGP